MAIAQTLERNEDGIRATIGILRQKFGERLQTGSSVRDQHAHTTTWLQSQAPDAVAFPASSEEVSEIVSVCATHRTPVIPFGVGTSLEGHVNAPAGGISIDFAKMNRVVSVHQEDLDCVVEPGITRKQLNLHLRDTGLFFPIDPGADATIGGMASTRASGTTAVRYGTVRDNVLALKAVMPDGRIVSTGARAKKSSAGYDLTRLLIGAEGTLGVLTEITLRLQGVPETITSASCTFPNIGSACDAVIATIQYGLPVARIELLDALTVQAVNSYSNLRLPESPLLLLEFHGSSAETTEQARVCGEIFSDFDGEGFVWTANPEERSTLWQARHDAFWATLQLRREAKGISTDVCVPISCLAECVLAAQTKAAELGFLAPIVGHAGDGNFHVLLLVDVESREEIQKADKYISWLANKAIELEGTCTGEHGIGQGKVEFLEREMGAATDFMVAIKKSIDPLNIMNPGKILRIS